MERLCQSKFAISRRMMMKLRTLWAMLLTLILTLSLGLTALAAGEAPMLNALVEAGKLPLCRRTFAREPNGYRTRFGDRYLTVVHGVMPILEWVIPPLLIKWGTLVW